MLGSPLLILAFNIKFYNLTLFLENFKINMTDNIRTFKNHLMNLSKSNLFLFLWLTTIFAASIGTPVSISHVLSLDLAIYASWNILLSNLSNLCCTEGSEMELSAKSITCLKRVLNVWKKNKTHIFDSNSIKCQKCYMSHSTFMWYCPFFCGNAQ